MSRARVPHAGMPPLEPAPPLSFFEFWPGWLFYLPVWGYVLALMARHRGVRLPMLVNPRWPAGGLYGESKSAVLDQVGGAARTWLARYVAINATGAPDADLAVARAALAEAELDFPLVAKPDLGCRGAGVRPVADAAALRAYLAAFPAGERVVLQELIDEEGEAGVFWVRRPGTDKGEIISLTLKYFPHVVGDGRTTLRALILADPRAGRLAHLYLPRHADRLDRMPAAGEAVRLAFAGSHSRGAIFRDGAAHVTQAMRDRFDAIADDIPDFAFGRFDIRFADIGAVKRGEGFRIVEINGAGAEATHIWDSRITLGGAYAALFGQWRHAFAIGAANRARGFRPEPWSAFLARRDRERRATPRYPPTA